MEDKYDYEEVKKENDKENNKKSKENTNEKQYTEENCPYWAL